MLISIKDPVLPFLPLPTLRVWMGVSRKVEKMKNQQFGAGIENGRC
jgi:hypothetical protein